MPARWRDRRGRLNSDSVVPADWQGAIPAREMWIGPQDSLAHFFRWAHEYRVYLPLLCGLRRDASVLELGCGHGRTMLGLIGYLRPPGRYEGLDASSERVAFATREITSRNPHLRFTYADLRSGPYNPEGAIRPRDFRFPYDDAAFDVAYAASLFTHLLPDATAHYFAETARVLRPGGKALFSFFLLERYEGPGTSAWSGYEFDHPLADGVATHDPGQPDQLVAYSSDALARLAANAGLRVGRAIAGYWTSADPEPVVNEQDLVLLERA